MESNNLLVYHTADVERIVGIGTYGLFGVIERATVAEYPIRNFTGFHTPRSCHPHVIIPFRAPPSTLNLVMNRWYALKTLAETLPLELKDDVLISAKTEGKLTVLGNEYIDRDLIFEINLNYRIPGWEETEYYKRFVQSINRVAEVLGIERRLSLPN